MRTFTQILLRVSIVVLGLMIASCATRGPINPAMRNGIYHTVEPGQNLWRICQAYRVDMKQVMVLNKITDPTKIEKGQKIFIPKAVQFVQVQPNTRWTHIVIHHSATFAGNADIFDKQHRQRGFWNGLGYHFVIDNGSDGKRDGQVEIGPRWTKQMDGAHCNAMNMNKVGIGICLVGNFDEDMPSQAQFNALTSLVSQLRRQFNVPVENILRHNMVTGKATDCPGLKFPWGEFKQRVTFDVGSPVMVQNPPLMAPAIITDNKTPASASAKLS